MSATPRQVAGAPADPAAVRREAAKTITHPLTRTLLLLTFSSGLVDAASYLGLGQVFTVNMTGNVVLLGFGIAGAPGLPVVGPLISLVAFVIGAGVGGLLSARSGADHDRSLSLALLLEAGLLAAAAVLAAVGDVHPDAASGDVVIAVLAFAIGARNATVQKIAIPDLTTTVLTMTLTGLAAKSRVFGGDGAGTVRRSAAVTSLLVGAMCGALLVRVTLWLVLAVAAGLAFATLVAYRATRRPPGPPPAGSRSSSTETR
jgi:uncharacterized membrane protein YoaK (UPF0700 family)